MEATNVPFVHWYFYSLEGYKSLLGINPLYLYSDIICK